MTREQMKLVSTYGVLMFASGVCLGIGLGIVFGPLLGGL
jgi:hypothetical protein